MNKENCALKLVDEIILYYDARSKKYHMKYYRVVFSEKASNLEGILTSDLACYVHVFYEKQWKI